MRATTVQYIVLVLVAIACAWSIHFSIEHSGIPAWVHQSEAVVRGEVLTLSSSQDKLHTLQLDRALQWHKTKLNGVVMGYIVFSASYLGAPAKIRVSWSKADTNMPIDKIEKTSASEEPTLLWSRK
jgi:hypothetical protein